MLGPACRSKARPSHALNLARLWRDRGKVQRARELLAPIYGRFNKGFDTRDLKDARTVLEELATTNFSTNVSNNRAIVGLRKCPSPGCAQLKFKFSETTIGGAANGVYKRL